MTTANEDEGYAQIMVRLPATILNRIDQHAERVRQRMPGVGVTRAGAVRSLLLVALASVEAEAGREPKQER